MENLDEDYEYESYDNHMGHTRYSEALLNLEFTVDSITKHLPLLHKSVQNEKEMMESDGYLVEVNSSWQVNSRSGRYVGYSVFTCSR